MTTTKTPNKRRVRYNFTLKLPIGAFTLRQLMQLNRRKSYITLNKRINKMISDGLIANCGTVHKKGKLGRSVKQYAKVQYTVGTEDANTVNETSGLKSLVLV
jgi:hypothetical protein